MPSESALKVHRPTATTHPAASKTSPSMSYTPVQVAPPDLNHLGASNVLQLQRVIGNQATRDLLQSGKQHIMQREDLPPVAEGSTRADPAKQGYKDFDGKQYRVSGQAPNRKIEEVKRTETAEGQSVYLATGLVVGFSGMKPVVDYYPEPVSLGDWYPRVTHVNGMNVKPEKGISDAVSLQTSINEELDQAGGDMALGQDAVDVLYTYSATLTFVPDVFDCLKGKMGFGDQVTEIQKQTILDAIHQQQRISVSAHSRGTIKTDNAVREAFAALSEELVPVIWKEVGGSIQVTDKNRARIEVVIRDIAKTRAKEQMDQYIQLIYAGNAVEFPSTILPIEFIVGSQDAISLLVGTYTETGVKSWGLLSQGNDRSNMTKISGHGHSFQGEGSYAPTVAALIGKDILRERR